MRLDHRQSAAILAFPQPSRKADSVARKGERFDDGRVANLSLMLIVLALAALWLAFPPAQLSGGSAPGAPAENTEH